MRQVEEAIFLYRKRAEECWFPSSVEAFILNCAADEEKRVEMLQKLRAYGATNAENFRKA